MIGSISKNIINYKKISVVILIFELYYNRARISVYNEEFQEMIYYKLNVSAKLN